jgi:hypothetical protein
MTSPTSEPRPTRVLFFCTKTSARSQMAETLLGYKSGSHWAAGAGCRKGRRLLTGMLLEQ